MTYHYSEKERLNLLFKNPHKTRVPVKFITKGGGNVTLSPNEFRLVAGVIGNDDKRIQALLSHKNIIGASVMAIREKANLINNNKSRRKK
jgi:hypothetical protein